MSEARINRISNEKGDGGPSLSGITTFSGLNYFVPPKGTTAQRPSGCPPGSIRFNTDSAHLEYVDGLQWLEFEATNDELGGSHSNNTGTGYRGLFTGGAAVPSMDGKIEYITISTLGNASAFGNEGVDARTYMGACASSTRALFAGGYSPGRVTTISFVTFSSTGNSASYGDLSASKFFLTGLSNETRGIFGGGSPTSSSNGGINVIEYVTIAGSGTAQDFGDLATKNTGAESCASSVRGIFCIGNSASVSPNATVNTIEYITISTLGTSQDFGDSTVTSRSGGGCSNSVRGVFGGGTLAPAETAQNTIDFITIASTGNAQDFGDLTSARYDVGACSSSTRSVWAGGRTANVTIDYVEIMTTGNATDFGDLTQHTNTNGMCGASNGHGGL